MAKNDWALGLLLLAGLYILGQSISKGKVEYYRCWQCNRVLVGKPQYCPYCKVELFWEGA